MALKKHGIAAFGAGINQRHAEKPLVIELNGLKVTVFAISEGEDGWEATPYSLGVAGWNVERLARRIRAAKKNSNAVIVIAHCGLEYIPTPPPYVHNAFKTWAEAGADLVVGHHPHVPQGMKVFGNTPAFFSLGNFVFYQNTSFYYRKLGYFLKVGLASSGLANVEVVPYKITDSGLVTFDEDTFSAIFNRLSAAIETEEKLMDSWCGFLDYYGADGFYNEVANILDKWREAPAKGAAMLFNRVNTMQHREHWKLGLMRIANDYPKASKEAFELAKDFFTKLIP